MYKPRAHRSGRTIGKLSEARLIVISDEIRLIGVIETLMEIHVWIRRCRCWRTRRSEYANDASGGALLTTTTKLSSRNRHVKICCAERVDT